MDNVEVCFPNKPNQSCYITKPDQTEHFIGSLVLSGLSALISFLNLMVIISVICFRQLQTSSHLILVSLATSDLLVGLVLIPVMVWTRGVCWIWGNAACFLYFYLTTSVIMASVYSMVLISVDRYIAIVDPMHYRSRMSLSKVSLGICLVWTCAVIFTFISMNDVFKPDNNAHCLGECKTSVSLEIDLPFSWAIPFGIISILYIKIFRVAFLKSNAICSDHSRSQVKLRSDFKAARNLGSVIVAFIVCYLPLYCMAYSMDMFDVSNEVLVMSVILIYANSAVNPIIYVLIYPQFRKAFRAIVTLKILHSERMLL